MVRKAEQMLVNDRSRVKEYLPIVALAEFNNLALTGLLIGLCYQSFTLISLLSFFIMSFSFVLSVNIALPSERIGLLQFNVCLERVL